MQIGGKELKITPASFAQANALQKAIGRALKGTKIELPEKATQDLSPSMFADIIDGVLGVATSDEVEGCLFDCLEGRALLGTDKIDRDFFEDVAHREFYYEIMVEAVKINVGPFFKSLLSRFGGLIKSIGNNQK